MSNKPKTLTMGPGSLTLNSTFSTFTRQLTKCELVPKSQTKPGVEVLGGGTTETKVNTTWAMSIDFLQDLGGAESATEWTFNHDGETVDFTFTPSDASGKTISGQVVITATKIGGQVGEHATADATWDIIGKPTIS